MFDWQWPLKFLCMLSRESAGEQVLYLADAVMFARNRATIIPSAPAQNRGVCATENNSIVKVECRFRDIVPSVAVQESSDGSG
jgi:hypothetical protein